MISFLIKNRYYIFIIIVGALISFFYYKGHKDGKELCELKNSQFFLEQHIEARKQVSYAEKKVSEAGDIDALLDSLGILRADTDR